MVYIILISVVFIAELIIVITIAQVLLKLDKAVNKFDKQLVISKFNIKEVLCLIRKISEQWVILSKDFVDTAKKENEDRALKFLSKILTSFLILNLNFKFVKKMRSSKITKTLVKGWSILESMV